MTDKELLELAAKAAGITLSWETPFVAIGDFAQVPYNDATGDVWNPLTDDGDALRLAVKLVEFEPYKSNGYLSLITDNLTATRRAIVRAAAAIGEMM